MIATLLTTQYIEEADALSDRIVVIDRGNIVAHGSADELKERAGGTCCEIVPRDQADVPAMIEAVIWACLAMSVLVGDMVNQWQDKRARA